MAFFRFGSCSALFATLRHKSQTIPAARRHAADGVKLGKTESVDGD